MLAFGTVFLDERAGRTADRHDRRSRIFDQGALVLQVFIAPYKLSNTEESSASWAPGDMSSRFFLPT
jgi:hypothetical protein